MALKMGGLSILKNTEANFLLEGLKNEYLFSMEIHLDILETT